MRLLKMVQVIAGWDLFFEILAVVVMFLGGLMVVVLRTCNDHAQERLAVQDQVDTTGQPATLIPGRTTPEQDYVDTSLVEAYLSDQGYALDRIMDVRDNYSAVVATAGPDSVPDSVLLMLLRADTSGLEQVTNPENIPLYTGPPDVTWESLSGAEVDACVVAWKDAVEGVVGANVYVKQERQFALTYSDPVRACSAAELVDIDEDGVPELLTYIDDLTEFPSREGYPPPSWTCTSMVCMTRLWQEYDVVPAWVSISRWTGTEWISVEGEYPEFYRRLQAQYVRAAEWVRGEDWILGCRGQAEAHLMQWAARAGERAESK